MIGATRWTPAARALVGVLALSDDPSALDKAAKLAGYSVDVATPVAFREGRCYRRMPDVRLVVRDGQIVRLTLSDFVLERWLRRLGKKLSFFAVGRVAA